MSQVYNYYTIPLFSDISGYECPEQQERLTAGPNTTLLNDNTGCDLNTAASRDINCNPVIPTESPVMNSDKCDGAVRVDLKYDENIISTINTFTTIDRSQFVELVKIQDSKQLAVHNSIHTGEKSSDMVACHKSSKLLLRKAKLAVHKRNHTGEKLLSCSTCRKTFRHEGTLLGHTRVHTGEKPFSCLTCGKMFIYRGSLSVHSRFHTGKNIFTCTICAKLFILHEIT